jgi:hypothetical protein
MQSKAHKLVEKIESHFNSLIEVILTKKDQIVHYFGEELSKSCQEYKDYDFILRKKYGRIKEILE